MGLCHTRICDLVARTRKGWRKAIVISLRTTGPHRRRDNLCAAQTDESNKRRTVDVGGSRDTQTRRAIVAAVDRVTFTSDQSHEIEDLRKWARLTNSEVPAILVEGGLSALRLRAATVLYATQPLTVSEVADRVHVDRGALLAWFRANGVAPWVSPDEEKALPRSLDNWLRDELSQQ